ncbi:MAG TPA: hypothetical protein VK447_12265 [Myxococcaceae bacterium]|nr:hypothetical protein [Myxococcaceae bacterium]
MKRKTSRSSADRLKKKHPKQRPGECIAPDCGRPAYARGFCQTHHRQLMTTGKVKPIRPYRKRSTGTVKFAGLRLTHHCAQTVKAYAKKRGLSQGAAIAEILEDSLTKDRASRDG